MRVRPVVESDRDRVLHLLRTTFPVRVPPDQWHALFDYPWMKDPPNYGFLLEDDKTDEVFGFIGAIYSERVIRGTRHTVCNPTSWCVREGRRGRAGTILLRAMMHYLDENDIPALVFSAGPHILPFLRRLGFVSFREFRGVRYSLPPLGDLLTGRIPRWVDPASVTSEEVGDDAYRIMRDHLPTRLRVGALELEGRTCVVITKSRTTTVERPRWAKRLENPSYGSAGPIGRWVNRARDIASGTIQATEIVWVSDPEFFRRHLRGIGYRMALRDRTIALTGDEALLDLDPPSGRAEVNDYLYLFPVPGSTPSDYDPLYSELAILEFTHRG